MHRKRAQVLAKGHDYRFIAATRCLEAMNTFKGPDLLAILPHISVLRDPRFLDPLLAMLNNSNGRKREFAILALGALREPKAVPGLVRCFRSLDKSSSSSRWSLQLGIVHTLGDIGSDEAVPFLRSQLPMFRDSLPISFTQDPPGLIARKLARRVASTRLALGWLEMLAAAVEKCCPSPHLLRPLYRWILGGHIYRGYQAGTRELSNITP